jgi:hypothetical protein
MVGFGHAQNQTETQYGATGIQRIVIEGDQIFEIEVIAVPRTDILLFSRVDGEYGNRFQVVSKRESDRFQIQLAAAAFSEIPDDKRNAHKVVAAAVRIEIPEDLQLEVKSDVGYLNVSGAFKSIAAVLQTGYFRFEGQSETLKVNTVEGDIYVKVRSGSAIVQSLNGRVEIDEDLQGPERMELKSIRGNIRVEKMRKD